MATGERPVANPSEADPSAWPAEPEDVRLPVSVGTVDAAAAKEVLGRPLELAAQVVPGVDHGLYRVMAEAAIDCIVDGRARRGVTVAEMIAEAGISRGHLIERCGPEWSVFTGLAVRAIAAQAGRAGHYEEVLSLPVSVRARHHGLGRDRLPGGRNSLHMIVNAHACSDRFCPTSAWPVTTGTRDAPGRPRADAARIEQWTRKLGFPPPASLAEHVEGLLERETQVRTRFAAAAQAANGRFAGDFTVGDLRAAFSRWLVIATLRYGPPRSRERRSQAVHLPGRDTGIVSAVRRAGRQGVLYCGPPVDEAEAAAVRDDFDHLRVGRLPKTYELGITSLPKVRYFWSAERSLIAREVVGQGARTDLWRLVGIAPEDIWFALSLIERNVQSTLPPDCIERWERDCGPGLLQARHPWVCAGCLDVLNAANAAIVDADRRRSE
ncbi:MAG: hypothetical protein M3141_01530 [Actinomycetota bacterium]|nr:hypothetical protein [Actinomycetota bacterium]